MQKLWMDRPLVTPLFDGSKGVTLCAWPRGPVDEKTMSGRRRMPVRIATAARDINFGRFFQLSVERAEARFGRLRDSSWRGFCKSAVPPNRWRRVWMTCVFCFQCGLRVAHSACSLGRTSVCSSLLVSGNVVVARNSFVELL